MKTMHWMSILGLIFITIGGILSFFGTQLSDKKSQDELSQKIQEKNKTIDNINSNNVKLIQQNSDLLNSNTNVSSSNQELISQNKDMLARVTQYQTEIEDKNNIIKELQEKVSQVERGIEFKIHFNGIHRTRQGGDISVNSDTDENIAFNKMVNYDKQRNYADLIKLCDAYINKQPQWYTPYIFKAISLLIINEHLNKQKALDLLDFASKNTIGDVEYGATIMNILLRINEQKRVLEILNKIPIDLIQSIEDKDLKGKLLKLKK